MGAVDHQIAASIDHLADLHAAPQWIVVLLVPLANGKTDKLPVDYRTTQVGVDAHDPAHWTTYEHARQVADKWGRAEPGGPGFTTGFVLTEDDPFVCVDLDNCADPSRSFGWSELAETILGNMPGAIVEVSQSCRGLHVWCRSSVAFTHSMRRVDLGIEMYSSRRFIAEGFNATPTPVGSTGMAADCPGVRDVAAAYFPPRETVPVHGDGPDPAWRGPTDDAELIRRMLQSKSARSAFGGGASFADLWERNVEVLARAYPPDRSSSEPYDASSADMALACHLAFWCGRDVARIERLMRQSGLVREKWDRADYLARTIANACAMQREVLQDKPIEPPPGPSLLVAPEAQGMPSMTPVTGDTFVSPAEQATMFEGCVYVADHHKVLIPGGNLLNPDRFRAHFGGYTFAMDARNERTTRNAWEAFTESQVLRAPRVDGTCFRPQLPYGSIVEIEGRKRANTWWPIQVRRVEGDITPFIDHMRLLLPHDHTVLLYWMAGNVQNPGLKAQWMPLIVGAEGNGKTFFSRCLSRAVGERYTHWVAADKIAAKFNEWLFGKLLYAIEDLKIGHNAAAWEKLKPLITGENVEIEGKGIDQRSDEICGNFIANSNHFDAIKATRNDRRVAHLHCTQQSIEDLARDGITEQYVQKLYAWAEADGYAIVANYLHTLHIPAEFGRGWLTGRAPKTSSTAVAIEHGRSPVEQAILDAIEEGRPGFAGDWISSVMVEKLIEAKRMLPQYPRAARDAILRGLGYVRHPALASNAGRVSHVVMMPDGAKPTLYVRNGSTAQAIQTGAEVARAYAAAQGAV